MNELAAGKKLSLITIWIIFFSWLLLSFVNNNYQRQLITSDAVNYWAYLPATFIEGDPTFSFLTKDNLNKYDFHYLPEYTRDGKPVMKMSMGLAMLLAPFFLLAHVLLLLAGKTADGYSQFYQTCTGIIGMGCYLILGLWHLRKALLHFFSDYIAAFVLGIIFFGTNLLYYAYGEPLLTHVYLFSLQSVIIYQTICFYKQPGIKRGSVIGFLTGLSVLIRPSMMVFSVIPVLYGVNSFQTLRERFLLIRKHMVVFLAMGFFFVLAGLPQLLYWKLATGHWLVFSYTQEHFFFNRPALLEMFFSYRKGWLLYTPVMAFALAGIYSLRKHAAPFTGIFLITLPVIFYLLSCWWVWWYGGSLSQRTFIDFYAMLAFSLGAFLTSVNKWGMRFMRIFINALVVLLSLFSVLKVWQYSRHFIHHDGMNKKLYWETLLTTGEVDSYWSKLHFPNYSRTLRGLPEYTLLEGKKLLIREDLDTRSGSVCIADTTTVYPQLTNAFGYMRIPHGNNIYAVLDFTGDKVLSDSCCLVMQLMTGDSIWLKQQVPLNKFSKEGKGGKAFISIPFQHFKTEQDLLKVLLSNPLGESFCIKEMWLCEEVYQ